MATSRPDPREASEALAIQALAFLAGEPEQLGRFLALTGIDPERLRAAAAEPRFLAGVLEHFTTDEALLRAFAAHADIDPAAVMRARTALAGPSWEREQP